jgi:hypothetical protein
MRSRHALSTFRSAAKARGTFAGYRPFLSKDGNDALDALISMIEPRPLLGVLFLAAIASTIAGAGEVYRDFSHVRRLLLHRVV